MRFSHGSPQSFDREDPAIRFVNTVAWRLRQPSEERLPSAETLLAWLAAARFCDHRTLDDFKDQFARSPRKASRFLTRARRLREAIYQLLLARIRRRKPPATALKAIEDHLAMKTGGLALAASNARFDRLQVASVRDADALLQPIAWSAACLLMSPRAARLKQCQDERGCGWLFIDESRLQNRRWCSMGDCGNRAKAHRHYHRRAEAGGTGARRQSR
ncbi:MAG: CGNR zinc finger domain-containing protein [Bradyrhizobium sp.]|uniref:CGNR zinc finger domain-containing protein n=1 Tax=Bradyrhizobium sp. TaxID=376 RepID=UPI001D424F06|nr:ABATE domain-containing protein [Bradyrhizobium sp.]MBV9560325.1 CGNR zinc finger domain-containing protein [Bradyrhizobium sp.]